MAYVPNLPKRLRVGNFPGAPAVRLTNSEKAYRFTPSTDPADFALREAALGEQAFMVAAADDPDLGKTLSEVILADSPLGYWKLDELSGTKAANSAVKAKNLMSYGSFEGAAKSGMNEWTGATLTMQQGSPAQGTYCARVDTAASIGSGISVGSQALDPTMYPEGTYNFGASIALKGAAGGEPVDVWIRAQFDNSAQQDGATVSPALTTGWTRVATPQATVVVPSGRYIKYLTLMVRTRTATACTFYADAAIQTEGTSAPATYFDGATPGCSWDGTANASTSTRDLDGTYTNSPTLGAAGFTQGGDNAASFDGVDDVLVVSMAAVALGSAASIEFWARPSAIGSSQEMMRFAGQRTTLGVIADAAKWVAGFATTVADSYAVNLAAPSPPVANDIWEHHVLTYDGARTRWYRNGVLNATSSADVGGTIVMGDLIIAGYSAAGARAMKMLAQHVALYPSALSASRISAHYRAGNTPR